MFILFIKKLNIELLVNNNINILIRIAKQINVKVIKMETLERWEKLKIYIMLFAKYFDKMKKKLLF